jgi:hypothetical protein
LNVPQWNRIALIIVLHGVRARWSIGAALGDLFGANAYNFHIPDGTMAKEIGCEVWAVR